MSYPYDADRDDPRPVRLIEGECQDCGARGYFRPDHGVCPACAELGQAPPPCPQCETLTLRGFQLVSWCFECSECDARFSMREVRRYALGLAVERIARDFTSVRGELRNLEMVGGQLLRAARELGVIRG